MTLAETYVRVYQSHLFSNGKNKIFPLTLLKKVVYSRHTASGQLYCCGVFFLFFMNTTSLIISFFPLLVQYIRNSMYVKNI